MDQKCPECGNHLVFDGEAWFCDECELGWKKSLLVSLSAKELFPMFEEMKSQCGGWISAQSLAMVYNAYAKMEDWPEVLLTKEGDDMAMLWNPNPKLIALLKKQMKEK